MERAFTNFWIYGNKEGHGWYQKFSSNKVCLWYILQFVLLEIYFIISFRRVFNYRNLSNFFSLKLAVIVIPLEVLVGWAPNSWNLGFERCHAGIYTSSPLKRKCSQFIMNDSWIVMEYKKNGFSWFLIISFFSIIIYFCIYASCRLLNFRWTLLLLALVLVD